MRALYFFCFQNMILLTNIFEKHTAAVPESEIKLAMECRNDFLKRFSKNDFEEEHDGKF
ncbi:MAG: hypothetical protein Ta2A_00920 [Treponemataceae bacterium]|nr:MAG: hypothetical protein Ta2A_00920 [Treponemataceae bacterium]